MDPEGVLLRVVHTRIVHLVAGVLRYYYDHMGPALQGLGYGTSEGLFSASEVGSPHERQRFFVLAHASGAGCQELGRTGEGASLASLCDLFPPPPDATKAWPYVLTQLPQAEPSFLPRC